MSFALHCYLTAAFMTLLACPPQAAQGDFLSEPFSAWTKAEVTRLLNDSPWAKTQEVKVRPRRQVRSVAGQVESTSTADRQAALGGAEDARDRRELEHGAPAQSACGRGGFVQWPEGSCPLTTTPFAFTVAGYWARP